MTNFKSQTANVKDGPGTSGLRIQSKEASTTQRWAIHKDNQKGQNSSNISAHTKGNSLVPFGE